MHVIIILRRIYARLIHYYRWFLPDKCYLKLQWKNEMNYVYDWNNPRTVNEKMMWLKLHDRKPLYTTLVDKVEVKQWIKEHFGSGMLIPTYKVYTSADEIDLKELPNEFVMKCNHDSGTAFICKDKANGIFLDKHMHKQSFSYIKDYLKKRLKHSFYKDAREWPYKNVSPRIIVEKLMTTKEGTLPNDYKLFFINDEFQFVYASFDRAGINDRCIFDRDWNRLPFVWVKPYDYREGINSSDVKRPDSFSEMLEFGKAVAKPFKCVRVDLYDVDGKMYFGEVTPFHSAGYARFYPNEYDYIYGEKIRLQ